MAVPTKAELVLLDTVTKVTTHMGIEEALYKELYATVGITDADHTHPGIIGNIEAADYDTVIDSIQIATVAPTLIQRSQLKLFYKLCAMASGYLQHPEDKAVEDQALRDHALALAKAGGAAPTATGVALAKAAPLAKKLKLTVLDQCMETEITALSEGDITAKLIAYHTAMGGALNAPKLITPLPEQDPSGDQISALDAKLKLDSCWVDFASWVPFGDRARRREPFRAMTLGPDGKLTMCELRGPGNFDSWLACFLVFKVAMVMCNAINISSLDGYINHIKKLTGLYGSETWGLLYQADHRARLEQIDRIRRQGALLYEAAVRSAGPGAVVVHDYDPNRPWIYCFEQLVADNTFWEDQFLNPAIMIKAKITEQSRFIDDDAHIEGSSGARSSGLQSRDAAPPPSQRERATPKRRSDKQKQNNVSNGVYTTNRTGTKLCTKFNEGTCTDLVAVGQSCLCPLDKRSVHQCAKCLSPHHGANSSSCQGSTADSQRVLRFPRGRGSKGCGRK